MSKIFISMILLSAVLWSAPAFTGEREFKQSDSSVFKGYLKGDEWFNWVQTVDGYTAKYNKESKNYEYMLLDSNNELVSSNIQVAGSLSKAPALKSSSLEVIQKIPTKKLGELWKKAWKKRYE